MNGEDLVPYFAYGSNLDFAQMKGRCPSASFVGKAILPDHRLVFPRGSRKMGGVAGVAPAKGKEVWGVVYTITESDLSLLDDIEGFDTERSKALNAYNRKIITVV